MPLYIARDRDGELRLHSGLPERNVSLGLWETGEEAAPLPGGSFPGLAWEHPPLPVGLRPLFRAPSAASLAYSARSGPRSR